MKALIHHIFLLSSISRISSFVPSLKFQSYKLIEDTTTKIFENRFRKELEKKAKTVVNGSGAGETAVGAVLGGLVLGPFGALFGASLGSSIGKNNAISRAKEEELERMGINEDILRNAREIGVALQQNIEALKATRESLSSQQNFAKRLDEDAESAYTLAKSALEAGNEEEARLLLVKRKNVQEKLKKALQNCSNENKRLSQMEDNVRVVEKKAMEMEAFMKRCIAEKALSNADGIDYSLSIEDPLLQKFRDIGIE